MKGIVFTEFIEMMEKQIGFAQTSELLENLDLTADGAYTAVGDYPTSELIDILSELSRVTGKTHADLLKAYGVYFAASVSKSYAAFFEHSPTLFDFLASIEDHIHVEVKKLYPKAKPPNLHVKSRSENHISLLYVSDRAMGHFAHGLIQGSAAYYRTPVRIEVIPQNESASEVIFNVYVENEQ